MKKNGGFSLFLRICGNQIIVYFIDHFNSGSAIRFALAVASHIYSNGLLRAHTRAH